MLMPACVCSGVSILKWQERSECSCRHPPVPAGAFCSGRSIHSCTALKKCTTANQYKSGCRSVLYLRTVHALGIIQIPSQL